MIKKNSKSKILVYSCSGCSSAAQMANWIALRLDREGLAEMSCIAGLGGGVQAIVREAKTADALLSLDGCAFYCVEHCLNREGLKSDLRWDLSQLGVRKMFHCDFEKEPAEEVYRIIRSEIEQWLKEKGYAEID